MTELTLRERQIEAYTKRANDLIPRRQLVRVLPRDEEIRKGLAHPDGWVAFPASGPAEWPLDQFTQRRIRDGSVAVDGPAPFNCPHNAEEERQAHAAYLSGLARRRYERSDRIHAVESAMHPGEVATRIDADHPSDRPTVAPAEYTKAPGYQRPQPLPATVAGRVARPAPPVRSARPTRAPEVTPPSAE